MAVGIRQSRGERAFTVLNVGLLCGLVVITAYPLLYVVFASLSEPSRLISNRGALLGPLGFSLDAYRLVLQNPMIAIGYRNTLVYIMATLPIVLIYPFLQKYFVKGALIGAVKE